MSVGNRMPSVGEWVMIVLVGISFIGLLMELGRIYGTN